MTKEFHRLCLSVGREGGEGDEIGEGGAFEELKALNQQLKEL